MSGRPDPARPVRQWVEKAEEDLTNAEHTLTMRQNCPLGTVCFHAQQCVEKYVKALLVHLAVDFPRTHDIGELVMLLPANLRPPLDPREKERLTDYATVSRYPGDEEPLSREEAEAAVAVAKKVREAIRRHLWEEASQ